MANLQALRLLLGPVSGSLPRRIGSHTGELLLAGLDVSI
jgi:hypothetical protein